MATRVLRKKQQLRDGHISAWRLSGLSQRAYCRQQNICPSTFANWLRRWRKDSTAWPVTLVAVPDEVCQFAQRTNNVPESAGLSLLVGRCCRIEIGKQFDTETFGRLITVLEGM